MPTGQNYASTAPQTQLVGGINNTQATDTVQSFTGWPATPFTGIFDIGTPTQEAVDVTGVSGTSITAMTRGVDGTSAQAHSNNATFTHSVIGRDFREMRAHIDAASSNDSTGHAVHGLQSGSAVVGTTDIQTLTNKTLTSPTITGMNVSNPNISGTVTGAAQYQNIVAGSTGSTNVELAVQGLQNQTADLFDVIAFGGTKVFSITANGATGSGRTIVAPTDTGNSSLIVNSPSGLTASIVKLQLNAVDQITVDNTGQLNALTAPLRVAGITGAANSSRYVGATAGGPPSSGTFSVGDWVVDKTNGIIWTCTTAGSPGTWAASGEAKVATTTLGAPAASINISSIPQYFKHLRLQISAVASTATVQNPLNLNFNNDTATHYAHSLTYQASSTTLTVSHAANNAFMTIGFAWGNSQTNEAGDITVDITNYTSTAFTNKAVKGSFISTDGGATNWDAGTMQGVWFGSGTPAAITSLQLTLTGALNFAAGTTVDLYGIA